MKEQFEISIPNPCQADWNKMTPNVIGKHCDSCNKTVVDFTKMSGSEIKSYFSNNSDNKTCGHFYKGQLKNSKNRLQSYFYNLYCDAYFQIKPKVTRVIVLFVLSSMLTIVGCNTPTQGEIIEIHERLTGDSIAMPIDKAKIDTIKNGL